MAVRPEPSRQGAHRRASRRAVRQQLGEHLPQTSLFRGGRTPLPSDAPVVPCAGHAVLSRMAAADHGDRPSRSRQMGSDRRDGDNRACVERGDVAAVRSRRHVARVLRYGYEARGAGDGGDAGDADAACRPDR